MIQQYYSVYVTCENCGIRNYVSIPKGEFIENYLHRNNPLCKNCKQSIKTYKYRK